MTELVTDGLVYWAREAPKRPAIVYDGDDVVDYRTLDGWTDAAAHELAGRGLRPGDRIGVIGHNSLEWCAAAIGALKLGAIAVPYNNRFTPDELRYLVEDSAPRLVLTDAEHQERMAAALADTNVPLHSLSDFTALRGADAAPVKRPAAERDDPAIVVYTSGTSSRPKGVVFTHRSMFNLISEFALAEPVMRPGTRIIYLLSMAGAPGLPWHILHPLTHGMTIFYERGFDAPTALRRIRDERIQVLSGVPVLYEQMSALPEFADADLSSLELATVAGARCSASMLNAWLDKGVTVRQSYGMTEMGGLSTLNPVEQAMTRPESVGRGTVFTRHRVVRPDGTDCDAEEPGEIIISGPGMTPGYWHNEQATAEAIRDGWFHSGDVGIKDADGYIRVVDRLKDLIITGGFNVAPSEIENVISEMPGVAEVCVISVHDPKFGETPAAIVYGEGLSEEAVTAYCRTRLAGYKVPRHVVLRDAPLERMASGKIARRVIRDAYAPLVAPDPAAT